VVGKRLGLEGELILKDSLRTATWVRTVLRSGFERSRAGNHFQNLF
jgi:hypothetical protein